MVAEIYFIADKEKKLIFEGIIDNSEDELEIEDLFMIPDISKQIPFVDHFYLIPVRWVVNHGLVTLDSRVGYLYGLGTAAHALRWTKWISSALTDVYLHTDARPFWRIVSWKDFFASTFQNQGIYSGQKRKIRGSYR